MNRGTWTFAVASMMALTQSGLADEPASSSVGGNTAGSVRISAGTTPSRTAKKASAKAAGKNYYKDLFAEEDATPPVGPVKTAAAVKKSAAPADDDWGDDAPVAPSTKPAKPEAKDDDFPAEPAAAPANGAAPSKATIAANKPKIATRVTHALYDRPAGEKTSVEQIRGDGRPRSAPPLSGFEEAGEKPAKGQAAKSKPARDPFDDDAPIAKTPVHESVSITKSVESNTAESNGPAQAPQIVIEWVKRSEFNVGQECHVDLVVKNAGESTVSQMEIDAFFPANVRLVAAEPRPASSTDHLTWQLDELIPASEKRIALKVIPSSREQIGAKAHVRFTSVSETSFAVSEPLLKVSIKSPAKEYMLADPISQMITLTNPGTGTAHDVKIEAKLSEGLEHSAHTDRLVIDVGSVGPGESRSIRLPLTAAKGGPQTVSVVATSSTDASSTDSAKFNIVSPSLKVEIDGPSLRYKGRNAKYTLTITNDGSLANNNIHITQALGDGFKFISADHHGKFDAAVKTINWLVGHLEPGESTQVSCELNATHIGEFAHNVQVISDTGVQADARIETRVDGIASLTLELADLDDPVETGAETGYEIRVKNDGTKAATGVILSCELPAGMEYLDAKAPVGQSIEGRQLTFKPIETIAAGGQITIRVHTKVLRDGSHRLRVRLTGGGLQDPLMLEEVTRAYSDNAN